MQNNAVTLAFNVSSVANQASQTWTGGKAALIIEASTYPSAVTLQVQNVSGNWVAVNSANITANGVYAYDIPAGNVRLALSGGSISAMYACLGRVSY